MFTSHSSSLFIRPRRRPTGSRVAIRLLSLIRRLVASPRLCHFVSAAARWLIVVTVRVRARSYDDAAGNQRSGLLLHPFQLFVCGFNRFRWKQ